MHISDVVRWVAQNLGVKYPIISTVIVMVLAGGGWRIFVLYAGSEKTPEMPTVRQHSGDKTNCSNVVVTGGTAKLDCDSATQEKTTYENGTDKAGAPHH